jgi:multisubunit Na+/H+ antiporter MnhB subunit
MERFITLLTQLVVLAAAIIGLYKAYKYDPAGGRGAGSDLTGFAWIFVMLIPVAFMVGMMWLANATSPISLLKNPKI